MFTLLAILTIYRTEKVTVVVSPKSGEASMPSNAQTLLNAIKNADTVTAFAAAVTAAKAAMDVYFNVNLGDGVDITGDGLADKGAGVSVVYSAPSNNATQVVFAPDTGAATTVGVQPVVLTQLFVAVGTGKTFAYSSNGTPTNTSDDKQGVYTLTGNEKVTVMASPRSGDVTLPANAQTLLNDIKNATTVAAFSTAVTAAKLVMDKAKAGASLESLAQEYSSDEGSKTRGGLLEWSSPALMAPGLGDGIKGQTVNQLLDRPVQSSVGWHVIRIEGKRALGVPTFEQLQPQLLRAVVQRELTKAVQTLVNQAKIN